MALFTFIYSLILILFLNNVSLFFIFKPVLHYLTIHLYITPIFSPDVRVIWEPMKRKVR